MGGTEVPTLYEWMGGRETMDKLITVFYKKVYIDPLLSPIFKHLPSEHSRHVANFIGEVFGGPRAYTEDDGGNHSKMVAHHVGKMLTETMRKRWVDLLFESADEILLVNDPEFRSAFVSYIEWGSRLALLNSQTTENPIVESEPMPRWGWGEVKGPYTPTE